MPSVQPLAPYVSAIWDYDDLLGGENLVLSILPDTAMYLCFLYTDLLTTRHKDRVFTTRSGPAGFQTFRNDLGGMGNVSGVSARLTPWGVNVFRRGIVQDCAEDRGTGAFGRRAQHDARTHRLEGAGFHVMLSTVQLSAMARLRWRMSGLHTRGTILRYWKKPTAPAIRVRRRADRSPGSGARRTAAPAR